MILLLVIAGILGIYITYKYPAFVAVVFFTLTLADVNFKMGGFPLNSRALIGIAAFARTLIDPKEDSRLGFFSSPAKNIPLFTIYTLLISEFYDLITFEFIKSCALTFIAVYLGYYYFFKKNSPVYFKISLIIAGVICFSDLAYTYIFVGSFPVQRIYQRLLGVPLVYDQYGDVLEPVNWGFYGAICGMSFLFILNDYINKKSKQSLVLLLLPVMFLGVLMSTSRSSLLGMIGASIFLISKELKDKERARRAYQLIFVALGVIIMALFVFSVLSEYLNLDVEFIERISSRLVDEPIAVLNKYLGNSYNAQELDALDWRGEASEIGFKAFLDLTFVEQFFGIGFWGYATRDLGHTQLPPHNGPLMILVEYGILGCVFWFYIFLSTIITSLKINKLTSPVLTILLFYFLYCLGQNEEMTHGLFLMSLSTLIAENRYIMNQNTYSKPILTST